MLKRKHRNSNEAYEAKAAVNTAEWGVLKNLGKSVLLWLWTYVFL